MVIDIVQAAISGFDGAEFTRLASCPSCGGPVQGYDTRQKKYAVLNDGEGERVITVRIKRFTCRNCNRLCNAEEPFYPGTRIGSLVVDLFYTFSAVMPGSRAARLIDAMGIRVDRTSWKKYSDRPIPEIPVTQIFGMCLPSSVLTLSSLAARIPEGGRISGSEALKACGFPSAFRNSDTIRHDDGTAIFLSGEMPSGQGHTTTESGCVSTVSATSSIIRY
jgi:hypothetical protein